MSNLDSRTTKEELITLSKSSISGFRCFVAQHPNTPIEVLEELSDDPESIVRAAVAKNHNCNDLLFQKLIFDKERFVVENVLMNKNLPLGMHALVLSEDNLHFYKSLGIIEDEKLKGIIEMYNTIEDLL